MASNFVCVLTISDINHLELIGEEIYDEFDFEAGNGTISSFVPSELADTKSFPETETSPSVVSQVKDGSPTTKPVVLRPLATRGLNFLRSTSAPPSPRSKGSFVFSTSATQPNASSILTVPATVVREIAVEIASTTDEPETTGKIPKESGHGVISASENIADPGTPRPTLLKKRPLSSSGTPLPLTNSMTPAVSKSASPASSLEAILLDRKRRLAAAGRDSGPMTTPSTSGTSDNHDPRAPAMRAPAMSSKGTSKFKSSPLGGGEQTGVVVAEKVKQDVQGQEEDVCIPDETNRTVPGKKEDNAGCL